MGTATNLLMVGGISVLGALVVLALIISRIIYICPPNEVLIFSGGHRRIPGTEDRVVGYRVVQGGRGIRIPLIEIVDRMDLTNMAIELRVQGAYSKGGIPLNVQGVANVKISSKTDQLANAVERFLGMSREQIMAIARETLEGNLRGVLSTLTPEEVNTDREKFAGELLHEADHDLARLGLELDTLKVQHVSDDKGYLASLGRKQSAELLKKSRIAEAENHALAAENSASNLMNQEIAKVEAEIATVRAEGQRRIAEAPFALQRRTRLRQRKDVVAVDHVDQHAQADHRILRQGHAPRAQNLARIDCGVQLFARHQDILSLRRYDAACSAGYVGRGQPPRAQAKERWP